MLLNCNLPVTSFFQPQLQLLEGDVVLNMAPIIPQHNLGVINYKYGYTDYPDHSLNFFSQDLRSTAHFGGSEEQGWGVAV